MAAGVVLAGAAALRGAQVTDVWNGGVGNWNTASNWSAGVVPNNVTSGTTYLVQIDGGKPAASSVTLDISAAVDGLTIDSGDALTIADTRLLRIDNGSSIVNNGLLTLNSAGSNTDLAFSVPELTISGTGSITLSNNVANRVYSTIGNGHLTLNQNIQGAGQIGVGLLSLTNNAVIDANQPKGILLQPNSNGVTNAGILQASNGGVLTLQAGKYTNTGNGAIKALAGSEVRLVSTTITGGTLSATGTGVLHNVGGVILSNVAVAGTYNQDNGTGTNLQGTFTLNGALNLNSAGGNTDLILANDLTPAGAGSINLTNQIANRIYSSGGQFRLTLPASYSIIGSGQIGVGLMGLTNNGTINDNGSAGMLIQPNAQGVLNNGTIEATNGALLTLRGNTFATGGSGVFEAMNGSELRLDSVTLSGNVVAQGSGFVHNINGVTLSNVSLTGNYTQDNGAGTALSGTFTQNGTFSLNSTGSNTDVRIDNDLTLGGTGTLSLSNNIANRIYSGGGTHRLTIPSTWSIQGSGQIGVGLMSITNNGVIDANSAGGMIIQPNGDGVLNTGTIQARNGANLTLQSGKFTNTGATIQALPGSELRLNGASIDGGTVNATGTQVHAISGASAVSNAAVSGSVNVDSGAGMAFTNVNLTGDITAGAATRLTLSAPFTQAGNFTLNGTSNVNNDVVIVGDVTYAGNGTINFSDVNSNRIYSTNAGRLTLPASRTFRGSGQFGVGLMSITNNSLIDSNGSAGLIIQPNTDGLINTGTIQASNGSVLTLKAGTFTNTGATIQAMANSEVRLDNATINGGALNAAAGAMIHAISGVTLNNVAVTGTYNQDNGVGIRLDGTFSLNGAFNLNSTGNNTDVVLDNDLTLEGTGSVNLTNQIANRIYSNGGQFRLTLPASQSIVGSGQIGVGLLSVTNYGTINANGSAGMIIQPNSRGVLNNGTIRASNGAVLTFKAGTFAGGLSSVFKADDTSEFRLDAATFQTATLNAAPTALVHIVSSATFVGTTVNGPFTADANTSTVFSHNATPVTNMLRSFALPANARLNLGNNNIRIDYSGGTSPAASVQALLTTGYNQGNWNGLGIDTSDGTRSTFALGFADSADNVVKGLDPGTVLIKFTRYGDANLDGTVGFSDLLLLAQHYGQPNARWDEGDFNYNGAVGFDDLLLLAQNYGKTLTAAQLQELPAGVRPAVEEAFAQVPEPGTMALGVLASGLFVRRRRPC